MRQSGQPVKRGRPVDPAIDAALARATKRVLGTHGWAGLTIERVAARAGVSRATVYRRHRSRYGLLLLVMADIYEQVPVADTGSLRGDLVALLDDVVAAWRDPDQVRFLATLVSAQAEDEGLRAAYAAQFEQRRAGTSVIVRRAAERGELASADAQDGDLLLDMLAGIVAQWVLLRRRPIGDGFSARVVDVLLAGFAK